MIQGTQIVALYQPRGVGWEGREEEGDICLPMADSCCCLTQNNKIL